ncbi:MAG: 16S rRNA (guanine(966)-N(2))-methyltransferase RsmD [Chloroflexota bacterium]
MSIRVIAGSAKGRKLKLVPGDTTRPVMDRVKESLFNIIGRNIIDATFLDLFAGTGSVGIEALSRGAKHAVFIDMERKAIQTIQDNITVTKFGDKATIRRDNAFNFLKQEPTQVFDFIYIAPPQYKGMWQEILQALDLNPGWVHAGSNIIVQIDPSESAPIALEYLETVDQRRYGNTLLWFFAATQQEPDSDAPQEKST